MLERRIQRQAIEYGLCKPGLCELSGREAEPAGKDQPGGQPMGLPPRMCRCR